MTNVGRKAFLDKLRSMRGLKRFLFGNFQEGFQPSPKDKEFATQVARGLDSNFVLARISFMDHLEASDRLVLDLNRHGRNLLSIEELPIGVWPLVLSRLTRQQDKVHLLYYFLRQKLDLSLSVHNKKRRRDGTKAVLMSSGKFEQHLHRVFHSWLEQLGDQPRRSNAQPADT